MVTTLSILIHAGMLIMLVGQFVIIIKSFQYLSEWAQRMKRIESLGEEEDGWHHLYLQILFTVVVIIIVTELHPCTPCT